MARIDPDPRQSASNGQPASLWRRVDRALAQLNPFLVVVAIGLLVLNLTCLATFLLPVGHLPVCVATTKPPPAYPDR